MSGRPAPVAETIDDLCIRVLRGLCLDMPARARSGHTGTALSMAPLMHILFADVLHWQCGHPDWPDRDRLVLSNGHASALLYAALHVTGQGVTMRDLRRFRRLGSRTPGHPERHRPTGVSVTTGMLGQGFANAVGLALAAQLKATESGGTRMPWTYVICSDGDLMEGVSHESASLAGHLRLENLVAIYDSNQMTVDGRLSLASSDQVADRFRAYGWRVLEVDGEDATALRAGLTAARDRADGPTLVIMHTVIGWPSPTRAGTDRAHYGPFDAVEISQTKALLALPSVPFWCPARVYDHYRARSTASPPERSAHPAPGRPQDAESGDALPRCEEPHVPAAAAIEQVNTLLAGHRDVVVGTADVTSHLGAGTSAFDADNRKGRLVHYGVREHAMAAVANGLASEGLIPVVSTFLAFGDYLRPSLRMAALDRHRVIYLFTHDSIAIGQDGPTHQPVEQLAALRVLPGLRVWRPADCRELSVALALSLRHPGPSAILLAHHRLPPLPPAAADDIARGGYVVDEEAAPDLVLAASGSEVAICRQARDLLHGRGVRAAVVSVPERGLLFGQSSEYLAKVLPRTVPVLAVEAAASDGWHGHATEVIGVNGFGMSGRRAALLRLQGLTPERVAERGVALASRARATVPA